MQYTSRLTLAWALLGSLALGWLTASVTASAPAEPLAVTETPTAVPPGVNLIVNPSFEGDTYHGAAGGASGYVAEGWGNWFRLGPDANVGLIRAPEWLPEDIWAQRSHMILHGNKAQKIFSTSATHDAGNWQVVSGLRPGQLVEFSVWVKVWSSDCGDPCYSPQEPCRRDSPNTNGNYDVTIGVDPTGAEPAVPGVPPSSVVWRDWERRHYDEFFQMTLRVRAQSDRVTVYTRGTAEWRVQNNFSFWDEASLAVVDEAATPTPTSTVYATVTPQPSATPPTTLTPTATTTRGPQVPHAFLPLILKSGMPPQPPKPTATPTDVPLTSTPTATATQDLPTPTPTATATGVGLPAASPTPSPTLAFGTCADVVANGGFEGEGGWQMESGVPYPAAIEAGLAHTGVQALRLGPADQAGQESFSYAWQAVTIPASAERATLSYWLYVAGGDANDTVDVELYTAQGVRVSRLLRARPVVGEWQALTADLSLWAGQTVQLWFNAYNDGQGATLRVYVDDVRLEACARQLSTKAAPALVERVLKPQPPSKARAGVPNVHFTWVRYSPEQIFRSRYCPECMIEWAYLVNDGDTVDLQGWTVTTERGDSMTLPSVILRTGDALRLWTGEGRLTRTPLADYALWDVYWGSRVGLLANAHDDQAGRLTLTDPHARQPAASICWGPTQKDPGGCPSQ